MADPVVRIRRSSVSGKIPTTGQLRLGELALNTTDGKLFTERESGGVGVGNDCHRTQSLECWIG